MRLETDNAMSQSFPVINCQQASSGGNLCSAELFPLGQTTRVKSGGVDASIAIKGTADLLATLSRLRSTEAAGMVLLIDWDAFN